LTLSPRLTRPCLSVVRELPPLIATQEPPAAAPAPLLSFSRFHMAAPAGSPPFSLAAPRSRAPSKGVGHRPHSRFPSVLLHPLRTLPPLISPPSMSVTSSGCPTASSPGVRATTDVGFRLLGEPLLRASWLPIAVRLTFPLPPRYRRATLPSPPVTGDVSPSLNATA
jgi:hypothetical protein